MSKKFKKLLLTASLILTLIGCNNNPYNCPLDEAVISMNDSIMGLDDYNKGEIRILSELDEPILQSSPHKSYRLVITYSFERDIWIYRIEKTAQGGLLTLKKTYQDYFPISDTTLIKKLTLAEWNSIEKAFNSNCFWTLPLKINRSVLDGRNCILEAYDPDKENPQNIDYFIAARWSPKEGTDFKRICDAIERLDYAE